MTALLCLVFLAAHYHGLPSSWAIEPRQFAPHTLGTALLMHASTAHLASNVITLAAVGLSFEQAHGARWLLALFLVGGAIANGAEYLADPSVEGLIMGASGGVLAVFGGLCGRNATTTLAMVPIGLALLWPLLPWATPAPDVAHVAHISGFLFGVLCACVARGLDYLRNSPALVAH